MTIHILALTPGGSAVDLLNSRMDDAALIGIHRLQGALSAGLSRFDRQSSAERFERLFTLFAIIAGVDDHSLIGAVNTVGDQACQRLQRVEGIAASADDEADVLALDIDGDDIIILGGSDGDIIQAHMLDNALDIFFCGLCHSLFDGDLYLCGTAAE